MIKDIWHTEEKIPCGDQYVVVKHLSGQYSVGPMFEYGMGDYEKWTYYDDLIAQADKAERLQKAVDIANEALKYARQRGLDNKATPFAIGTKADKALDEIRQLIKEQK